MCHREPIDDLLMNMELKNGHYFLASHSPMTDMLDRVTNDELSYADYSSH